MTLQVGSRVLRKGWERYADFQHLARRGRVTHVAGPQLVEVRWDSAAEAGIPKSSTPARIALERIDDLTHLWWRRST